MAFECMYTFICCIAIAASDAPLQQSAAASGDDFIFDLPDLVLSYANDDSAIQLEAFKTKENDQILRQAETSKYNQLYWVSLGSPRLIRATDASNGTYAFRFTPENVYVMLDMLSTEERIKLAAEASAKYRIQATEAQIKYLVLSHLTCEMELFDARRNKVILLSGKVSSFRKFPLRVVFPLPEGNKDRAGLEDRLKSVGDLEIRCKAVKAAKLATQSTLFITTEDIQRLQLANKLFGDAQERYVTKNQFDEIVSLLYTGLHIYEEYDVSELRFGDELIKLLAEGISASQFSKVPIAQALQNLSPFNIADDIQPDQVIRDLGKIFSVNKTDGKDHIIANRDFWEQLNTQERRESTTKGKVGLSFLNLSASVNRVSDNRRDWQVKTNTVDDQLHELNTDMQSNIEWEVQGTKVIPKSIDVLKLARSQMSKSFRFGRIRRVLEQAAFERSFALSLSHAREPANYAWESSLVQMVHTLKSEMLALNHGQHLELQTLHQGHTAQQDALQNHQEQLQALHNGHAAQQDALQSLQAGHDNQHEQLQALHRGHAAQHDAIAALEARRSPSCPLYRFWNPRWKDHLYTVNRQEPANYPGREAIDYTYEGISGFVACP